MAAKKKTAGYSGTPLDKKLGIKAGHRVAVVNDAINLVQMLAKATGPVGARHAVPAFQKDLTGRDPLDVIVFFTKSRAELKKQLSALRKRMAPACGLWIAWPKKSSGVATDITEDTVREIALPTGLVDNKVCALDETWSGLRLVIRVENR
jgi:hypothetical protein